MKGKPIPFLAVLVVTIVLTIFFGAWAVSEDLEAQGVSAFAGSLDGGTAPQTSALQFGPTPISVDGASGEATDPAWWQDTLLTLCPLH